MGILDEIDQESSGIIPNSINCIFENLENLNPKYEHSICLSMIQIYKEEIFDLLNPQNPQKIIREDTVAYYLIQETKIFNIPDLLVIPVKNPSEAFRLINAGLSSRAIGSQNLNYTSSRSHLILTIYLRAKV